VFWFLRKRIDILAEADEFMESLGQSAYQEARYELAKAFERGDKARMKILKRVCKEIAERTDFEPAGEGDQEPNWSVILVMGCVLLHRRPDIQ
jgi:hypothetical protein